jgi:hypothetical protein
MTLGTQLLSDDEFVAAFEACTLPPALFNHPDHIRLAWIFARRHPLDIATARIGNAIRRFATHNGATTKYHETITHGWMRLVANATNGDPDADFEAFAAQHPELFDKACLATYYSTAVLASDAARARWVEPDLSPLP